MASTTEPPDLALLTRNLVGGLHDASRKSLVARRGEGPVNIVWRAPTNSLSAAGRPDLSLFIPLQKVADFLRAGCQVAILAFDDTETAATAAPAGIMDEAAREGQNDGGVPPSALVDLRRRYFKECVLTVLSVLMGSDAPPFDDDEDDIDRETSGELSFFFARPGGFPVPAPFEEQGCGGGVTAILQEEDSGNDDAGHDDAGHGGSSDAFFCAAGDASSSLAASPATGTSDLSSLPASDNGGTPCIRLFYPALPKLIDSIATLDMAGSSAGADAAHAVIKVDLLEPLKLLRKKLNAAHCPEGGAEGEAREGTERGAEEDGGEHKVDGGGGGGGGETDTYTGNYPRDPRDRRENAFLALIRHLIFPIHGTFRVPRDALFGGDTVYDTFDRLASDYSICSICPADLKVGLIVAVQKLVEPIQRRFRRKDLLQLTKEAYPLTCPPPERPANKGHTTLPAPSRVDIRVGQIQRAWRDEMYRQWLCAEVDVGGGRVMTVASDRYPLDFTPDDLALPGRVVVVCNLKSRQIIALPFEATAEILIARGARPCGEGKDECAGGAAVGGLGAVSSSDEDLFGGDDDDDAGDGGGGKGGGGGGGSGGGGRISGAAAERGGSLVELVTPPHGVPVGGILCIEGLPPPIPDFMLNRSKKKGPWCKTLLRLRVGDCGVVEFDGRSLQSASTGEHCSVESLTDTPCIASG